MPTLGDRAGERLPRDHSGTSQAWNRAAAARQTVSQCCRSRTWAVTWRRSTLLKTRRALCAACRRDRGKIASRFLLPNRRGSASAHPRNLGGRLDRASRYTGISK